MQQDLSRRSDWNEGSSGAAVSSTKFERGEPDDRPGCAVQLHPHGRAIRLPGPRFVAEAARVGEEQRGGEPALRRCHGDPECPSVLAATRTKEQGARGARPITTCGLWSEPACNTPVTSPRQHPWRCAPRRAAAGWVRGEWEVGKGLSPPPLSALSPSRLEGVRVCVVVRGGSSV